MTTGKAKANRAPERRICPLLMKATGRGVCTSGKDCSTCKYHQTYTGVLPMTYEYLRVRIAQKRTHISREQKRLRVLEALLDEVEAVSGNRRG